MQAASSSMGVPVQCIALSNLSFSAALAVPPWFFSYKCHAGHGQEVALDHYEYEDTTATRRTGPFQYSPTKNPLHPKAADYPLIMPVLGEKLKPRYHGERVTREEYLDMPDDGFKYDMIEGVLFMAPSPNFDHNDVNGRFTLLTNLALMKHRIGRVAPETDLFLPDGDDVLRPDVCFILNENSGIIKTHIHGVPDLICEILSASTRKRDLGIKADRYLKNGVKEYWILDPEEQEIHLWLNRKDHWEKYAGDHLKSNLIPGLEVTKASIFP